MRIVEVYKEIQEQEMNIVSTLHAVRVMFFPDFPKLLRKHDVRDSYAGSIVFLGNSIADWKINGTFRCVSTDRSFVYGIVSNANVTFDRRNG